MSLARMYLFGKGDQPKVSNRLGLQILGKLPTDHQYPGQNPQPAVHDASPKKQIGGLHCDTMWGLLKCNLKQQPEKMGAAFFPVTNRSSIGSASSWACR
jgi:hypothetical protein